MKIKQQTKLTAIDPNPTSWKEEIAKNHIFALFDFEPVASYGLSWVYWDCASDPTPFFREKMKQMCRRQDFKNYHEASTSQGKHEAAGKPLRKGQFRVKFWAQEYLLATSMMYWPFTLYGMKATGLVWPCSSVVEPTLRKGCQKQEILLSCCKVKTKHTNCL